MKRDNSPAWKHGTALKTANSHANVRRRATVSLDAGKSKDLLKENTRKYFSEKYQSYYFVNHLTGETCWDSEKIRNQGKQMIRIRNKKSPDITVWCTKNITYTMPKLTKLDGQLKKPC